MFPVDLPTSIPTLRMDVDIVKCRFLSCPVSEQSFKGKCDGEGSTLSSGLKLRPRMLNRHWATLTPDHLRSSGVVLLEEMQHDFFLAQVPRASDCEQRLDVKTKAETKPSLKCEQPSEVQK
ncbi:hypothetical protein CDAR_262441 [Caerostris darwini]|uniref:Uncharacterized protein n=1 Tax=Caerostris darwini TaxID=1538125 RepID=A0AAV4X1A5_9ARAC|nr:hypothetical protein CDAR_262441 [Caerostris darwini]